MVENMDSLLIQLRRENDILKASNKVLHSKFIDQEKKFITLQRKFGEVVKSLNRKSLDQIESKESAVLLPQQKGVILWFMIILLLHRFPETRSRMIRLNTSKIARHLYSILKLLKQPNKLIRMSRLLRFPTPPVT